MPVIELQFPALGQTLPVDHGYALYGAIARVLKAVHDAAFTVRIGPIAGTYAGNGLLQLDQRRSRLRLRIPADAIPLVLPLAGQVLDVAGHRLRLGVPQVHPLIPAPSLISRLVVIKASSPRTSAGRDPLRTRRYMDPPAFLEAVRRELQQLDIHGEPALPLVVNGPRAGQPRRRVLRIRHRRVVGFAVEVTGLTAAESIRLQEEGLGGRGKMGAGFFAPQKEVRN